MSEGRVAVIDMGSNTARLVVFRLLGAGGWYLEDEIREVVRLRAGMTAGGMARQAVQRGIAVLRLFRRFCDNIGVDTVIATATSAVRDAGNGADFLKRAKEASGWDLRVLSNEEEARLGVLGVLGEVPLESGIVVDIGGGSAQISRVRDGRWLDGVSLPLGALRLTELFRMSDTPTGDEVEALRAHVNEQLDTVEWLAALTPGEEMAGLGGSIRNLGYMEHAHIDWPLPTLRGFEISAKRVDELVEKMLSVSLANRARIPGLNPDRADILPAGSLVLQEVMRRVGAAGCHTSVNGLREGLLLDHLHGKTPPKGEDLRVLSVDSLACRYGLHGDHRERVRHLSTRLFDDLVGRHGLDASHRKLLEAAALLHDVGSVLGYHDHHKHSQYLITLNGLPGYTARETALIALLTRYHRKGTPTPGGYRRILEEADVPALRWMSAFLRMAEYLERGRRGTVTNVEVTDWGLRGMEILLSTDGDATVEEWDTERRAVPLLESVSGARVRMSVLQSGA
ncbi:MAG: exopolyphosphatase/guanosine-5'-triphosphate,3'-diphosphate pyrophosphatase [Rhodothermales bacterium]|jgi:exopolyphosphatase/guanosine-5'-triphosphate,3'-diphosphate pyrophosphatase